MVEKQQQDTTKTKQQLLSKEVFSPQITTVKRILLEKDGVFGRSLNRICEAGSLIDIKPNNLVERLELLILETKAGHD